MQFFADTAEIEDIKKLYAMGLLDGITTNPSLIAKSGRQFKEVIKEICGVVPGPVSAEVASVDYDTMMKEAHVLAKLADNVVVKVPLTVDGLRACKALNGEGIKTNVTLCFSPNQALLAAKCGATYISPFLGRLDDINLDGVELIEQIRQIYDNYNFTTRILAASIRTPNHITQVALAGADVATIPPAVIYKLADHPLTKSGLDQFVKDWKATGQSIL
jgi:transaldolase